MQRLKKSSLVHCVRCWLGPAAFLDELSGVARTRGVTCCFCFFLVQIDIRFLHSVTFSESKSTDAASTACARLAARVPIEHEFGHCASVFWQQPLLASHHFETDLLLSATAHREFTRARCLECHLEATHPTTRFQQRSRADCVFRLFGCNFSFEILTTIFRHGFPPRTPKHPFYAACPRHTPPSRTRQ